ncbi:hypothetical protein BC826DRAFT_1044801 [Russula brevipes]|nr:hypothetical protein BC826DRAFT_1044801 [Russula brevipes]
MPPTRLHDNITLTPTSVWIFPPLLLYYYHTWSPPHVLYLFFSLCYPPFFSRVASSSGLLLSSLVY